jgi:ssDNA-binding replication factor A large subunit
MFSLEGTPLAQANLQNDSIRKLKRLPEEFLSVGEPRTSKKLDANTVSAIGNLRFGLRCVSFTASVVRKSATRAVSSKDGNPLLVCDVMLSDGTGEIPLAVWNNQIGTISLGDMVQVQNARVRSYRGEIQLALSRKTGLLTVLEHATERIAS